MKKSTVRLLLGATVLLAGLGSLQTSNAQAQSVSPAPETLTQAAPVVPPPDIQPSSPLAQVARLTQAGVDQSVIMTYVTNSTSTFNLDSDRIIYLSNLGVPSTLITAMMARDQQLQTQFAAAQAALQASQIQPQPAPASDEPAPAPATNETVDTQPAPVSTDYFDSALTPYGSWVVVGGYGRCWRPTVCIYNPSWQPYCDRGHWVYSDCGWYWSSDYSWGATFHYGRWFNAVGIGWCWYPDTVWAPSWVTWRYSDNYCGWAPLPPRTAYRAGVGIVYNGGSVSVGFNFGLAANCYTFVPTQHFCDPHPHNYRVAPAQATFVYNNTTVINNYNVNNRTIVNHGIAVQNVAAATRTTIRPVSVHELNDAGAYNRHVISTAQPYSPAQNHFLQPRPANMTAITPIPQRQTPVTVENKYEQTAPEQWHSTETPRNAPHNNYYAPHQNYSHSSGASPQQHSAPVNPQPAGNQPPH
jgi:hypothetical protein